MLKSARKRARDLARKRASVFSKPPVRHARRDFHVLLVVVLFGQADSLYDLPVIAQQVDGVVIAFRGISD